MNPHNEQDHPTSSPRPLASWYAQGHSDGLGDRLLMFDNTGGPSLELLRFHPDLAQMPGFEAALREQVQRLRRFHNPAFAQVRAVQRLEPDGDLALISNNTPGKRLSEILHEAHGPAYAATLIRQLAPALALFQQQNPGSSHGLLSPDRIVVSPEGQLTIVEHVVGPAIDALDLPAAQLASMGIALPPTEDGAARLDAATDWYQLGLVAMSVLMGRPVPPGELPQLEALLDRAGDAAGPDGTPLSPFIRQWLDRALQISGDRIDSGEDAHAAWLELLEGEPARGSRQIEPPREEPTVDPPVTPASVDERVAPSRDVASATPPAVAAAPVQPPVRKAPIAEPRVTPGVHRRPVQPRPVSTPDPLSPFEREVLAGRIPIVDARSAPAVHARTMPVSPLSQPAQRRGASGALIATLVLIAVLQAGVITWLARALWLDPQPALVVETTPSGEHVKVNGDSPAPLRLAAAPDLRWVRVSSPATGQVPGGKAGGTAAGTIQVSSPLPLKIFEGDRLLGSVPGAGIRIPAGPHDIALVNEALGIRVEQSLEIEPGQTVAIHVAPPPGWVTIDASPWAEVSIDGRAIGRTPLGPLPLAPGEYQITFQHPTGGSDRQGVTVKSEATVRVVGKLRP